MAKVIRKVAFGVLCVFSAALIAGNVVCFQVLGVDFISAGLGGTGASQIDEETASKGSKLVKKVSEEGTVLLKNINNTLPLNLEANNKINVFGYTCTDNAWAYSGIGSGSCIPDPAKRIGILGGLKNAGFNYNTEIVEAYEKAIPTSDPNFGYNQYGKIIQPDVSFYTNSLLQNAKAFSDTALVVLSRESGENVGEIPTVSKDYMTGDVDDTRSYLALSAKEEGMLEKVESNFDKVIVLLNTTNNMECGFLTSDKIGAALYCGPTGVSGAESVANLLAGQKTVADPDGNVSVEKISPSGRLADTYAYDYSSEPAYANAFVRNKSTTGGNIVYQEGMYFGYRWYETADKMGFFSGLKNGYDSAVVYPFGHGLSYTDFSWEIKDVSLADGSYLDKDSSIKVKVDVTNIGNYPGKDVVELYYSAPYISGQIEKSSINLGDYAKTAELQPGQTQTLTLSIRAYDMASYDCYDQNGNSHTGYELDKGDYVLSLRSDVHTLKDMEENTLTYKLPDTIKYNKDIDTDYDVINRFTGDDGYAGIALDGSNVGINATYLSRNDFVGTYIDTQANLPKNTSKVDAARIYRTGANDVDTMPEFSEESNLRIQLHKDGSFASSDELNSNSSELVYNDSLVDELLADYSSPKWDQLVDQASKDEVCELVEKSGFGSSQITSIGKASTLDFDGPSGFNENTQKIAESKSSWTSYPPECVVGCTWNQSLAYELGQSVAYEASKSGINGWYAPGVNLHRSNYNGRNYEYYSEDPYISGKQAAATINGAKTGGLYCYLKHFVLSEEGDNAKGVDTWITEQALRELYLKPFELAVKGGATGVMSAFNRIGPVWAGSCYDLMTEILRNEWGFKGSVVTDWASGDEIQNTPRGVLAGNDMWLNPMARNYAPLDKDDPSQMYCAKLALKHNIYTYISSYQAMRDYNTDDDDYKVDPSTVVVKKTATWWIPTLISIDCVTFIGTLAMGVWIFVPWNKIYKKKED